MAALKPNTSSYARDLLRPRAPRRRRRRDRGDGARPRRRARPSRGLRLDRGRARQAALVGRPPARAASFYRLALAARPGYAPALDALARVEAARGRLGRAVELQRRAVEAVPLPGYVAQLGDLLASTGRTREAREQYDLVAAIEKLQAANGSRIDLETRALPHRPRHPPRRDARARPPRPRRSALDRRRRRARVGARPQRPLRRGSLVLRALAPARHPRRVVLLPPRHDRALPRPGRRRAALVPPRARHESALLAPLEPDRTEVRSVKRLLVDPRRSSPRSPRPRRRSRTRSATSPSTATRRSSSPAAASTSTTRSTWPRSRPSSWGRTFVGPPSGGRPPGTSS